jgi:membrane protease subunit (stomatin/prohibitin family)
MASYMQYKAARSLGDGKGQGGGAAGGMVEAGAGLGIGMMLPQMMNQQSRGGAPTATAAGFCTSCGRGLGTEDRFCGGCGTPVKGDAPADPGPDQDD